MNAKEAIEAEWRAISGEEERMSLCRRCERAVDDVEREMGELESIGELDFHTMDLADREIDLITEQCGQLGGDDCRAYDQEER